MPAKSLYQKILDSHVVKRVDDEHVLLYVDLHIMNEYTSPQAFQGIRQRGLRVLRPARQLAMVNHVIPPRRERVIDFHEQAAVAQSTKLAKICGNFGIDYVAIDDLDQDIEHVIAPELGYVLPGMVVAAADSHSTTLGALGALGFGIGASEVAHVLATQTLVYRPARTMKIHLWGQIPRGCYAKDLVLALMGKIGAEGARDHVAEFCGRPVADLSVEGRMTLCHMTVEAGARGALIDPDYKVFSYLDRITKFVRADRWSETVNAWEKLGADPEARYDKTISVDLGTMEPQVTWGTSADQVVSISDCVPDPRTEVDPLRRENMTRALQLMGLCPGEPVSQIKIDKVRIGSDHEARIEDLRAAAMVAKGKTVAAGVAAIVVAGSQPVVRQAEAEGLDRIFRRAGFEWRSSDEDVLTQHQRCACSTSYHFDGRQGGGRTHLMSPAMAAGAAVAGHIVDVRTL